MCFENVSPRMKIKVHLFHVLQLIRPTSSIEMIYLEISNWVLEISQRKALQVANSTNLVSLFSENPCPWQRSVSL